jgi:hypothetical protein
VVIQPLEPGAIERGCTGANDPFWTDVRDRCFFIVGCQRSGTTLMRLILECHSRIQCCDEAVSYGVIAGRQSPPIQERPLLGFKIPCLTEQLGNTSLWDAFVLPEVPNVYCGQPVLFMVRDVRDTIASMLSLRPQGRSWLETHMLPCLRSKIRRDSVFRKRYASDLAQLDSARHPKLARAAFYWRYKVDALVDCLDHGFPVLLIRYEDLVRQAHLELLRVCGFLRIPWEAGLLRHHTFVHGELGEDGLTVGGTDANRPIDGASIHKWSHLFNSEELEEIVRFAGDAHAHLYPESFPR